MDLVPVSVDILPNSISGALSCLDGPYVFEYSNYAHFFETVKDIKGPLLLIDYGYMHDYFHPDRMLGGMMCYQNNTSVPFSLKDPGSMDITTGVNWILFEELAEQYGFQVENFGPQSDFILSQQESTIGLADLPLLHEHEMGYYIKVMSLVRTN